MRDSKVSVASLRTGKSYLERAIQQVYPLKLSCYTTEPAQEPTMNADAEEFRARRNTSKIVRVRINDLANDNREGPFNQQYLITND